MNTKTGRERMTVDIWPLVAAVVNCTTVSTFSVLHASVKASVEIIFRNLLRAVAYALPKAFFSCVIYGTHTISDSAGARCAVCLCVDDEAAILDIDRGDVELMCFVAVRLWP